MGLTRAGASLGDAGARAERLAARPPAGGGVGVRGASDLSSQKPCVTPRVIDGDVPSRQEHSAASGGFALKGETASTGERVDQAQARTSGVLFQHEGRDRSLGVGGAHHQPTWISTYSNPRPYAFPAGWHSATV